MWLALSEEIWGEQKTEIHWFESRHLRWRRGSVAIIFIEISCSLLDHMGFLSKKIVISNDSKAHLPSFSPFKLSVKLPLEQLVVRPPSTAIHVEISPLKWSPWIMWQGSQCISINYHLPLYIYTIYIFTIVNVYVCMYIYIYSINYTPCFSIEFPFISMINSPNLTQHTKKKYVRPLARSR